MNKLTYTITIGLLASLPLFTGCETDEHDDEVPVIDMSGEQAFPENCVTVYRGESFTFVATFTDNKELGSYSLEMHHNFDHHTHSTDGEHCEEEGEEEEEKTPVNPFLLMKNYPLPEGLQSYNASVSIDIPADSDPGMYHFKVRLTDAAGWSAFKGISLKIADRSE